MRKTTVLTISILLVGAAITSATTGSQENPQPATTLEDGLVGRVAVIEPGQIVESLETGEPFELPTVEGSVMIEEADRHDGTIKYTNVDASGNEEKIERPSRLWDVTGAGGNTTGTLLAAEQKVRARLATDAGTSYIEPVAEGPGVPTPILDYKVYRLGDNPQPPGTPDQFDDVVHSEDAQRGDPQPVSSSDIGPASHIQVYKSVYAYVDTQYRDQYGSCCWADQVDYMLGLLNNYMDDVELAYTYGNGAVDTSFNTNDFDAAWDNLLTKSWNGEDARTYWSYRDFDGCTIGRAFQPGSTMMIQHRDDNCHTSQIPDNDAERAYLSAHEFGHNNDADHDYHWSDTTWYGHEHRSIMDGSAWGHYHECWTSTNMNRMANHLGTSAVGSSCN